MPAALAPEEPVTAPAQPATDRTLSGSSNSTRWACEIWRSSTALSDPAAAPAVVYLTGRGIQPRYPETLAFNWLEHRDAHDVLPTLVVARHCPVVGLVRGIQRIFLDPHGGGKYRGGDAKMSLGEIAGGRAELLSEFRPQQLLLAEGVETCLSAAKLMGCGTAWAMCGGFPREIPLPPSVGEVVLIADNDPAGTSEKRARALARWIRTQGRRCAVRMPREVGTDANDTLRGAR